MAYLVANNAFTAQGSSCSVNPSPNGSYGYRVFGTKCVLATAIDRVVLACGDGENSTYASSWWHYDIDNRAFTRMRPDPSNLVGHGAIADSPNHFQDFYGVGRGDNRQLVYHPPSGTVWEWGGNATVDTSGPNAQDATWGFHYLNGVYTYDPATSVLTKPDTTGWTSDKRFLAAGCGWDPVAARFLQVMGESGSGGFSQTDTKLFEIDPSVGGPGGTITPVTWPADGVTGPLGRTNIAHQFVYHSRARKWILFGGNSGGSGAGYPTWADTWAYDAVARTWTRLADGPEGRAFACMWYDSQNNVVLLTGGTTSGGETGPAAGTTWVYSLEYNRWTNLGIPWTRKTGGVVYDSSRNLAVLTPGDSLTDTDVYTFRYAIPRAQMDTGLWYGLTTRGSFSQWLWSEKHATMTYLPSATPMTASGTIYIGGGDTIEHAGPLADGSFGGGLSYQQNLYSLNLYARFATPANLNAGAAQVHGWCVSSGQVMPKHWDFYGITADPTRRILWIVPGLQETASAASENCPGESTGYGDDAAGYLHGHILQFNPATGQYLNVTTNNDIQFPVTSAANVWPWITHYDAGRDQLLRIKDGAVTNNRLGKATNLGSSLVWSNAEIGGPAEFKRDYWAWDPQRRVGYIADRVSSGHLYALAVDTNTLTDLGILPGTPIWPSGRVPADKGFTTFDWNARKLIYIERNAVDDLADVVWAYDPDAATWLNLSTTYPVVTLDGAARGTAYPSGSCCVFDPDNNAVLLGGHYAPQANGYYYWAIRLSTMAPSVVSPVPNLVSIAPASCAQGQTVVVTATGAGNSFIPASTINWDGAPQPTIYLNANTLTFTVTAALSAIVGDHSVTVTNPAPGGGTSLATTFTVTVFQNPVPALVLLSPSQTPFNSATLCTVSGTNFIAGTVVNWDGAPQPTIYISATQVAVHVTGALASVLGSHSVTATNPPPGGGTSNSLTFVVTPLAAGLQPGIFASVTM